MTYLRTLVGPDLPDPKWSTEAQVATDRLLRSCASAFASNCRAAPSVRFANDGKRSATLMYGRGLGRDEAWGFMRALESGLIVVAPDGGFQVPGARACSKNLHLVGRNEAHMVIHTEVLIHVTAYAELVLDHRWSEDRLVFDPFVRGAALDIWGFAEPTTNEWWDGDLLFASEAKARAKGADSLDSLLSSFHRLASDPTAAVSGNHQAKWQELTLLTRLHDIDLLLVADEARWWFRVTNTGEAVRLTALDRAPKAPDCDR